MQDVKCCMTHVMSRYAAAAAAAQRTAECSALLPHLPGTDAWQLHLGQSAAGLQKQAGWDLGPTHMQGWSRKWQEQACRC